MLRFCKVIIGVLCTLSFINGLYLTQGLTTPYHPILPLTNRPFQDLRRLKALKIPELKNLARILRQQLVQSISKTGGHLSASLGTTELTLALHYVFDAPNDKIIWDVSHQAYIHKMLTGRANFFHTLRKKGGLSGFCKRDESIFDSFGAGHSSTSVSAAQGMSLAQKICGKENQICIAVIGDGGLTGGMAFEALNSAGYLRTPILVILNDNEQVSLPTGTASAGGTAPVGALSKHTARLITSQFFVRMRNLAKHFSSKGPVWLRKFTANCDEIFRNILTGGTFFEKLGFYYIGPIDGHDMELLVSILQNLKTTGIKRPTLLHVKTKKGQGYDPALSASDRMHGVVKFDVDSGKQVKPKNAIPTLTNIFSKTFCNIASKDPLVVGITAAMPGGTGLTVFGKRFPDRLFDVAIAEQHAVTLAAGLAAGGAKPFCCIYSTFLQRSYDQIIHDIAIQKLPVRFIIDRAGMVGADGATHQGSFDLAYLGAIPNMIVMAPSDQLELEKMIQLAYETNSLPSAIRYPKLNVYEPEILQSLELDEASATLKIGKGRIVRNRMQEISKKRICILTMGTRLMDAMAAATILESKYPVAVTVADARFLKPLDEDLVNQLAKSSDIFITVEEGCIGGFGSHVLDHLSKTDQLRDKRFQSIHFSDKFIDHATLAEQNEEAGVSQHKIVTTILSLLSK